MSTQRNKGNTEAVKQRRISITPEKIRRLKRLNFNTPPLSPSPRNEPFSGNTESESTNIQSSHRKAKQTTRPPPIFPIAPEEYTTVTNSQVQNRSPHSDERTRGGTKKCCHRARCGGKLSRCCLSVGVVCSWLYSHPTLRVICTIVVLILNALMFSEDPQSYSNVLVIIPVLGNTYNFLVSGYPDPGLNFTWFVLKLSLVVCLPILGLLIGEILFRRVLLKNIFGLRGFKGNNGMLTCAMMSIFGSFWWGSVVWTYMINNRFSQGWLVTLMKTGKDHISYLDLISCVPKNTLPMTNSTFSLIAFYITMLGDCYTIFAVLDGIMQNRRSYKGCCNKWKTYCWTGIRIPLFWIFIVLSGSMIGMHANEVMLKGKGHLYWQGSVSTVNTTIVEEVTDARLATLCEKVSLDNNAGEFVKYCHLFEFRDLQCRGKEEELNITSANIPRNRNFKKNTNWFVNHIFEVGGIHEEKIHGICGATQHHHHVAMEDGDDAHQDGDRITATLYSYESVLDTKIVSKTLSHDNYEKNPPLKSVLLYEESFSNLVWEKLEGVYPLWYNKDYVHDLIYPYIAYVPNRGYWGWSEVNRVVLAAVILVLNLVIITQDSEYPYFESRKGFKSTSKLESLVSGNRKKEERQKSILKPVSGSLFSNNEDDDIAELDEEDEVINIPGLNTDHISIPDLFWLQKINYKFKRCCGARYCTIIYCLPNFTHFFKPETRFYKKVFQNCLRPIWLAWTKIRLCCKLCNQKTCKRSPWCSCCVKKEKTIRDNTSWASSNSEEDDHYSFSSTLSSDDNDETAIGKERGGLGATESMEDLIFRSSSQSLSDSISFSDDEEEEDSGELADGVRNSDSKPKKRDYHLCCGMCTSCYTKHKSGNKKRKQKTLELHEIHSNNHHMGALLLSSGSEGNSSDAGEKMLDVSVIDYDKQSGYFSEAQHSDGDLSSGYTTIRDNRGGAMIDRVAVKARRQKMTKNRQFITARKLIYTILFVVTTLDILCLYSQLSYTPESYGQIVDHNGYVHTIPINETDMSSNEHGEPQFEYYNLQLLCPYKYGDSCLTKECAVIHDGVMLQEAENALNNGTQPQKNILRVAWEWLVEEYSNTEDVTFEHMVYSPSVSVVNSTKADFYNSIQQLVVDSAQVEGDAKDSLFEVNGDSPSKEDQTQPNDQQQQLLYLNKDGTFVLRLVTCSCFLEHALRTASIVDNEALKQNDPNVQQDYTLKKLANILQGELNTCSYDEVVTTDSIASAPWKSPLYFYLLDGVFSPSTPCSSVVVYELKLSEADLILARNIATTTTTQPHNDTGSMNVTPVIYWAVNMTASDLELIEDAMEMDVRCVTCSQNYEANVKETLYHFSHHIATTSPTWNFTKDVNITMVFELATLANYIDNVTLTTNHNDSASAHPHKFPHLTKKTYTCVATTGPLNIMYRGDKNAEKEILVTVAALSFLFIVILRISLGFVYRSLLKWQIKYGTQNNSFPAVVGINPGSSTENQSFSPVIYGEKRKYTRCKSCLLNMCLYLRCRKKCERSRCCCKSNNEFLFQGQQDVAGEFSRV